MARKPSFDVWVCEGRMCSGRGADRIAAEARALLSQRSDGGRCRVLRGGCYGLCEIGANVVVRRFADGARVPDATVDRLTLKGGEQETVYSGLDPQSVARVLSAHLDDDRRVDELTRAAREASAPPASDVAARIRALREKRRVTDE